MLRSLVGSEMCIRDSSVNTLHEIEKSDIQITIIDLGIQRLNVNGKMNIAYKIIIPLMSTIAELERKAILQRTKEGRQAYVLSGGKLGRPTGSKEKLRTFLQKPKTKQIAKMLHMKKSYRDIEARTGAATSTIKKVKDITIQTCLLYTSPSPRDS